MAIEDVQTNLRLPSNLKERLQGSADAAGRSLSAEAAHRLALSYELEQATADLRSALGSLQTQHQTTLNYVDSLNTKIRSREREVAKLEERLQVVTDERKDRDDVVTVFQVLEQSITAAVNSLTTYDVRIQLAKSRLDSLDVRRRMILSESGALNRDAKTDEEFAQLGEVIAQLRLVEKEVDVIGRDLESLQRDREGTLKQIERMQRDIEKTRKAAEGRLEGETLLVESGRTGSVNKIILAGNIGRDSSDYGYGMPTRAASLKAGLRPLDEGDIVPPGLDTGSQHRPPAKRVKRTKK
ncbi:MAG: hypothetical protein Q8N06_02885 [Hydrogenophaga sp.]|nr:hypothetical protein [Hydrogenophaga sp.]